MTSILGRILPKIQSKMIEFIKFSRENSLNHAQLLEFFVGMAIGSAKEWQSMTLDEFLNYCKRAWDMTTSFEKNQDN